MARRYTRDYPPDMPVNVWRARHPETGLVRYVVGDYDPTTQLYTRSLTDRERKSLPHDNRYQYTMSGTFGECARHSSYDGAGTMARKLYGYSRVADAVGGFGYAHEPMHPDDRPDAITIEGGEVVEHAPSTHQPGLIPIDPDEIPY